LPCVLCTQYWQLVSLNCPFLIAPSVFSKAKKKYMSVYDYILQKNRVGRSDFHFILFFHFISYTEIPDCGPIHIRKRYWTLEYIWLLSGLKVL
jgi:hypothetical protein